MLGTIIPLTIDSPGILNMSQQRESNTDSSRHAHARNSASFAPDWQTAVDEVLRNVMCSDDAKVAPELVVMFVSAAWSDAYQAIVDRVRTTTSCRMLIGCSSSGVVSGSACHESAPGISLIALWLPDAMLTPWYLDAVPDRWPWPQPATPENVRGIMLFSDPYRTDAQSTLVELRKTCPGVPMVGALASTTRADRRSWVFLNDTVYDHGAVALTLEGPYDLMVTVSQGGTPIGEIWTVTETDHNQLLTISNRPALDVLHDTLDEIAPLGFGANDMLIGFPMDEYQDTFERDDFVARGILGAGNQTGSIMAGGIPRLGQSIQFLVRDAHRASVDLHQKLAELQELDIRIVGGILSTCKGRGTSMFGRNDHDSAAVARALPDVPVVGLYSGGELGPVGDVPAYNAFAAVLGLIVERTD
ncbi:MAG: FIST C-terminal domain-containing protein [Thermomicrobiales bacterium]|nr:FIST C-terminal domain-containing protein [Thermomicrobiales bacterium]MCO5226083.1 FIST C-terminal domain-containing protein [Thermomicrobiales bacterium]